MQARRINTFKDDRPEGPLRAKATGSKGHYVWLGLAQRAITLKKEVLDDKNKP
jgi:hypothetical protein